MNISTIDNDSNFIRKTEKINSYWCSSVFAMLFSTTNFATMFYLVVEVGPLCVYYRSAGLVPFYLLYSMANCRSQELTSENEKL